MRFLVLLLSLAVLSSTDLHSQTPFGRGVNLTGWFQAGSAGKVQFSLYSKEDITDIKSLGCDVIRLPINLHSMTSGGPDYLIDPLLFTFLDSVVSWAEELDLYLILDNHSFDPNVNTSSTIVNILVKVWPQIAQHYKERSDYIMYEILNEPHGIAAATWGTIQGQVIDAIRAVDTKHTIIVGGTGYNSYTELQNIPAYTDQNLIYTFHFYDPFIFTHQGASWVSPSMEPLAGVPFPYNSAEMPVCPPSLAGTWVESGLNNYANDGTIAHVKSLIDIAANFKSTRNVNVFCGEFGVLINNSDPEDRRYWYGIVSRYLEEKGISWTTWDYHGGFGLFNKGSDEMFDHDLNVDLLDSLDFNIPPQTPFVLMPDSTGFLIYTDYIEKRVIKSGYGGDLNFYSSNLPNNGNFCIDWKNFSQYNSIGFSFKPDKDLSRLVSEGFALDFMVRGNTTGIRFDVRFIDTKEDGTDHPWRISFYIDETVAAWDKKWHHVNIDLSAFAEKGSWDNDTWYTPQGLYDWSKVDRLEFSTEYTPTSGKELWFDNIHVTNQDTALVRETGTVGIRDLRATENTPVKVSPNPFDNQTTLSYFLSDESSVSLKIVSLTGSTVRTLVQSNEQPGWGTAIWDGCSDNGSEMPSGLYLCVLTTAGRTVVCRVIKN